MERVVVVDVYVARFTMNIEPVWSLRQSVNAVLTFGHPALPPPPENNYPYEKNARLESQRHRSRHAGH